MNSPGRIFNRLAVLVIGCLLGLTGAGCKSTDKPETAQFASVEIRGRTPQQIRAATADVMREHGYKAATGNVSTIVFEKEGSTMNNIAYGNWMGGGIATRAKISLVPVTDDMFRLECHAFLVRSKGEAVEEEITIKGIHRGQYQKMMNEIGKRLGQP